MVATLVNLLCPGIFLSKNFYMYMESEQILKMFLAKFGFLNVFESRGKFIEPVHFG